LVVNSLAFPVFNRDCDPVRELCSVFFVSIHVLFFNRDCALGLSPSTKAEPPAIPRGRNPRRAPRSGLAGFVVKLKGGSLRA
jgi:hypothetical protein